MTVDTCDYETPLDRGSELIVYVGAFSGSLSQLPSTACDQQEAGLTENAACNAGAPFRGRHCAPRSACGFFLAILRDVTQ